MNFVIKIIKHNNYITFIMENNEGQINNKIIRDDLKILCNSCYSNKIKGKSGISDSQYLELYQSKYSFFVKQFKKILKTGKYGNSIIEDKFKDLIDEFLLNSKYESSA